MEHFIIKANNEILAGVYLHKIWPKCMIRCTYASKNPRFPAQVVGQAIASLYSRKVLCPFATNEQSHYDQFSERPLRKLMTMLPDGTLVWNRKYSRQLILNSSWLGFHYIGDDINASSIKKWKDDTKPKLLCRWVKMLHICMKEKNAPDQWQLPHEDDIPALLAIVCRGSPKLRATLRIVAELVILHKKKMDPMVLSTSQPPPLICMFPGTQFRVSMLYIRVVKRAEMRSCESLHRGSKLSAVYWLLAHWFYRTQFTNSV